MRGKHFLILALVGFISSAQAAEESTSILVTGQVVNACTITAPTTMEFGAMTLDEEKALTDQISVTCNNGAAYTIKPHDSATISVTGTLNGSAMNRTETMTGASSINVGIGAISLYKDSSATTPWSDASTMTGTGNAAAQNYDFALKFVHNGTDYGNFTFTLRPTIVF